MTPEVDETPPRTESGDESPAEAGDERPAPRVAWPVVAPVDGMPRWLAWIVLLALLGAGVASTWHVLTLPPAKVPATESERGR